MKRQPTKVTTNIVLENVRLRLSRIETLSRFDAEITKAIKSDSKKKKHKLATKIHDILIDFVHNNDEEKVITSTILTLLNEII